VALILATCAPLDRGPPRPYRFPRRKPSRVAARRRSWCDAR